MASVFLSYDREDVKAARSIANALEKAGHSVWWDRNIKSGAQYSKAIEQALAAADAVVVLWSERSVESAWVRDEAVVGRDSGRLVPVTIDEALAPLGFRQYQTTDLSKWKGRVTAPAWQELLGAVQSLAEASRAEPAAPALKVAMRRPPFSAVAGALVLVALIAGLLVWRPWIGSSPTPIVAIAAASPSPSAGALARDLLTKLGSLQSTQIDSFELVQGDTEAKDADFVFEVDGKVQNQMATANLVLLAGKDRALLWSKNFEQPLARQGDLNQQMAYTAAKVLECTVEALGGEGPPLQQQTLKIYLNGCSAFSEVAAADPRSLVPVFRAVVEQAPQFEGAWAKLLHAETAVATSGDWQQDADKMKPHLLRHMAAARKLNPDMAELLLAEADLAPHNAHAQRLALIERAVERNPHSSVALVSYSMALMKVGRGFESVDKAKRAAQLDPLSPFTRDALITALAYNGDLATAFEELRRSEQLWPGASNLLAARYRIHLRYGNPNEALRIQRLGEYGGPHRDAFLKARIDPTPANIEKAISFPRKWVQINPGAIAELAQVLGEFGREEDLFAILLSSKRPEYFISASDVLFRPALKKFRYDPRMIAVAKRLGLLDYWQKSGNWPDFCVQPDLPYNCKAEAAKLAA